MKVIPIILAPRPSGGAILNVGRPSASSRLGESHRTFARGRVPVATNGSYVDAKPVRVWPERRAAFEKPDRRVWVEMTRPRAAASGHRTFNVGYPTMNPMGRPSQSDPKRLQTNVGCSAFSPTSELIVIPRPSARIARPLAARATML